MPLITITIDGPRKVGKSILARRLRQFLIGHGLQVDELEAADIFTGKDAITSGGALMSVLRNISPRVRIVTRDGNHEQPQSADHA